MTGPARERGAASPVGQASEDAVVLFDDALSVQAISRGAARLLGLSRGAGARLATLAALLQGSDRLDQQAVEEVLHLCTRLRDAPPGTVLSARPAGAPGLAFGIERPAEARWRVLLSETPPDTRAQGQDALTGLVDRGMFAARLAACLGRPSRTQIACAVHVLALDLPPGAPVAEALLHAASRRLSANTREQDLVGRLGAAEFGVLQSDVTQPTQAAALADRLGVLLGRPFRVHGTTVGPGLAQGHAMAPRDGTEAEALLRLANGQHRPAGGDGTVLRFPRRALSGER